MCANEYLQFEGTREIALHQLYRAMGFLGEEIDQ